MKVRCRNNERAALQWFGALAGSRPQLVITHAEDNSRAALARIVGERYGIKVILPVQNQVIEV